MRNFNFTERSSTIEVHSYAIAVRAALRRCRVFLVKDRVVGLRLPPDAPLEAYKDAVEMVLKGANLNEYVISTITVADKADIDTMDAVHKVRFKAAVVVLIQDGAKLPSEIVVLLDRIVDVSALHARHLIAGAKSSVAMVLPLDLARKLTAFPSRLLFLALRPGRPLEDVLGRLETHMASLPREPTKAAKWEPRVEELEGYGLAGWPHSVVGCQVCHLACRANGNWKDAFRRSAC